MLGTSYTRFRNKTTYLVVYVQMERDMSNAVFVTVFITDHGKQTKNTQKPNNNATIL